MAGQIGRNLGLGSAWSPDPVQIRRKLRVEPGLLMANAGMLAAGGRRG